MNRLSLTRRAALFGASSALLIPRSSLAVPAGVSAAPSVYLPSKRLPVGHRVGTMGSGNSTVFSSSLIFGNYRWAHKMGPQPATDLQIVDGNWGSNVPENVGANTITLTRSVEYPAGTFTQVTWGGATSVTLAPGQTIVSDAVPVEIPAGVTYFIRGCVQVASAGMSWPVGRQLRAAAGDTGAWSTSASVVDMTMSGTITGGDGSYGFHPLNVLGRVRASQGAVLLVGDSIMASFNDVIDAIGNIAFAERALSNHMGWSTVTRASDSLASILAHRSLRTKIFGQEFTHAICELAVNDLNGGPSLAAVQANLTALWTALAERGMKVWQTTITPHTTSTDAWITTVNQTPFNATFGPSGVRSQLNDWIRTTPAPLSGYLEVADVVETSRNSGLWVSPSGVAWTTDGLHPVSAGHIAIAATINAGLFASF